MSTGGSNDITTRIINEVTNLDKIQQNEDLIKDLTDRIITLDAAMKQAGGGTQAQEQQLKRWANGINQATAEIKQLEAALDKSSTRMKGMLGGVQAISRGFQDFVQGGLGGILNNFEQLGDGISKVVGRFAWLGPALTIAGTAAYIFRDKLAEMWEQLWPPKATLALQNLEKLQTRLKDLQEKPVKLAIDLREMDSLEARIDRAQKALAAFESAKSTNMEDDLATRTKNALKSTIGSEGLSKAINDYEQGAAEKSKSSPYATLEGYEEFEATRRAATKNREEAARLDRTPALGGPGAAASQTASARNLRASAQKIEEETLPKLEEELKKRLVERQKVLAGEFASGSPEAIERIRNMMDAAPHLFDKGFREQAEMLPRNRAMARDIWDSQQQAAKDNARINRDADFRRKQREDSKTKNEDVRKLEDAFYSDSQEYKREFARKAVEQAKSMQNEIFIRLIGIDKAGGKQSEIEGEVHKTLATRGFSGDMLDDMTRATFKALTDAYKREIQERVKPGGTVADARARLAADAREAIHKDATSAEDKRLKIEGDKATRDAATAQRKRLAEMRRDQTEEGKAATAIARQYGRAFNSPMRAGAIAQSVFAGANPDEAVNAFGPEVFGNLQANRATARISPDVLGRAAEQIILQMYEDAAAQMSQQFDAMMNGGMAGPRQAGGGRRRGGGGFRSITPDAGQQGGDMSGAVGTLGQITRGLTFADRQQDMRHNRTEAMLEVILRQVGNQNSRRNV